MKRLARASLCGMVACAFALAATAIGLVGCGSGGGDAPKGSTYYKGPMEPKPGSKKAMQQQQQGQKGTDTTQ